MLFLFSGPVTRTGARFLMTVLSQRRICKPVDAPAAILGQGANEFRRIRRIGRAQREHEKKRRTRGREREERKEKKGTRYLSRKRRRQRRRRRTSRPGALCEGRKKGTTIYKARHHRNWASLRQTVEERNVSSSPGGRRDARSVSRGSNLF